MTGQTGGTAITDATDPFDSYPVSDFDGAVFCAGSTLDHSSHAFVATDLSGLSWEWEAWRMTLFSSVARHCKKKKNVSIVSCHAI